MKAQDDAAAARSIGNCYITPPARGTFPPARQVWGRIPVEIPDDPDPLKPCWHSAPTYGASGEGFSRNVLCVIYD